LLKKLLNVYKMKFELYKDKAEKYRFRLLGSNGQIILTSEAYESKAGSKSGVAALIKNAQFDEQFERKMSKNGLHYFNLKAKNGQIIGTSELFASEAGMEGGILIVKKLADQAVVEEASS